MSLPLPARACPAGPPRRRTLALALAVALLAAASASAAPAKRDAINIPFEQVRQGLLDVTGRLIGGCVETVGHLAGTPWGDVRTWAEALDEPTVVYVEACEDHAVDICRHLHAMRLAGWFDRAAAVLVGRTNAPDHDLLTQRGAVEDALGRLGVPVVWDLEIGHVPPHLPLVNGALARGAVDGDRREITQTLA